MAWKCGAAQGVWETRDSLELPESRMHRGARKICQEKKLIEVKQSHKGSFSSAQESGYHHLWNSVSFDGKWV